MHIRIWVSVCALLLLAGAFGRAGFAAAPKMGTFYVGTCKPGKADYPGIQAAVAAVPAGSTVNVCPGVYPEQITITRPLTLQGVTSGNNAQVTITAPANGALIATVPFAIPTVAQITVASTGGAVNLSGLTVDGSGLVNQAGPVAAIAYNSNSGAINHIAVRNLQTASGTTYGLALRDDQAASPTITVTNSIVTFAPTASQRPTLAIEANTFLASNGTTSQASGGTINLTVNNSVVSGATTGLSFGLGVAPTISGNLIDGAGVTGASPQGIGAGSLTGTLKVSGNTIINQSIGISIDSSSVTSSLNSNMISSSEIGILLSDLAGPVTITGNQIITSSNPLGTGEGIDLACASPLLTASGNTFVNNLVALANVSDGSAFSKAPGTYVNIPSIERLCQ